jgi:hypothetical protein
MDALSQAEVGSALQVYFNLRELPQARGPACPPPRPSRPRAVAHGPACGVLTLEQCPLALIELSHGLAAGHRSAHLHACGQCQECLGRPVPRSRAARAMALQAVAALVDARAGGVEGAIGGALDPRRLAPAAGGARGPAAVAGAGGAKLGDIVWQRLGKARRRDAEYGAGRGMLTEHVPAVLCLHGHKYCVASLGSSLNRAAMEALRKVTGSSRICRAALLCRTKPCSGCWQPRAPRYHRPQLRHG